MLKTLLNQVNCILATSAVSQLVCFSVLFNPITDLRQALKTYLSSSHSHKYYLFFLVSGRILKFM